MDTATSTPHASVNSHSLRGSLTRPTTRPTANSVLASSDDHQVDLVVAGAGDHHVAGLQAGVLQQRDLAGVGQHPLGGLDPARLDRLRVPVDQHHLVAVLDQLTGDRPTHRAGSRDGDPHQRPSTGEMAALSATSWMSLDSTDA